VLRLHQLMAGAAGVPRAAVSFAAARPGELARSALDPTRARLHLGWAPWTSMEEGAEAVLRWFAAGR
ncbi:MAG TPA: hypothetical protein VGR26_08795, partial [Acidimicrobiales bacterium]|nr:hypothetical protein [Acidimicrobiales bacterium]